MPSPRYGYELATVRRLEEETALSRLDGQLVAHVAGPQSAGGLRRDLPADSLGRFLGFVLDGVALAVSAGYPVDVDALLPLVESATAPK